jgi:hypothetical protein
LIEACRGDQQAEAWIVCDHHAIRRFGLGALGPAPLSVRPFLRSGYIKRGNTVRGLAEACGIDAAGLERTSARSIRTGIIDRFLAAAVFLTGISDIRQWWMR